MSGGSLNYFYCTLEEHAGDFGDRELDDLVSDLARLFHDREWYLSCDTGVGEWNRARDQFKAKWFTEHGRQERIERYLAAFVDELRRSFGISPKYCENCSSWKADTNSQYGRCGLKKHCLMHRLDCCSEWVKKKEEEKNDEIG